METEQEIIRLFFRKERQERLYWEISGKKRSEFFWHLAGTREFMPGILHDLSEDKRPLKQILQQAGAGSTVYYIGSSHIGPTSLTDALTRTTQGEMCLIYLGKGAAYWQGEQGTSRPRALLFA